MKAKINVHVNVHACQSLLSINWIIKLSISLYFRQFLFSKYQIQTSSEEKNSGWTFSSLDERDLSRIVARTVRQALIHLLLASQRRIASVSSLLTGLSSGSDTAGAPLPPSANQLDNNEGWCELDNNLCSTYQWLRHSSALGLLEGEGRRRSLIRSLASRETPPNCSML